MVRLAGLLLVALALGACSDDDAPQTAPPTTSTPAPSSASTPPESTTPTTLAASTTTIPTNVYREELVLIEAGAADRALLEYRAAPTATPIHLEITETLNDSHWAPGGRTRDVVITGQSVPTDAGLRLELEHALITSTTGGEFSGSHDLHTDATVVLTADGSLVPLPSPSDSGFDHAWRQVVHLLRSYVVPLPTEPVGVGARWTYTGTAYGWDPVVAEYEVVAIDGPLLTLEFGGTTGGYDGDRYGGNHADVTHSGRFTIDLSSGRIAGSHDEAGVSYTSITGERQPGTDMPFARRVVLDVPARYDTVATPDHTVGLVYSTANDTTASRWTGSVERTDDGGARFSGIATDATGADERELEFEFAVSPDGAVEFGSTGGQATPGAVARLLPRLTDGATLHGEQPVVGHSDMWLDVSLGGLGVPVAWEVRAVHGSQIELAASGSVDLEFVTRGADNHLVGTVSGEMVIDLFAPFATSGSIGFEGTYAFSGSEPAPYREHWALTTTPANGAVDSADG